MDFDRYRTPVAMSDPGRHAVLFDGLPRDPGALAGIVQGLLIHQHIAPAYGATLGRDRQAQSHIRGVEQILDEMIARDGRPLATLDGQKPASGIWYKKGPYELRGKGDAATLTTPGQPPIACTVIR